MFPVVLQSCPVGRGPEFSRAVFDVHGHSPLVEQFLKMQRLAKDAGTSVLIKRTEIKQLPPYLLHSLCLSVDLVFLLPSVLSKYKNMYKIKISIYCFTVGLLRVLFL